MKNPKDMKKDELLAIVLEQEHLASAVDAKDGEINRLNAEITRLNADIKKHLNDNDVLQHTLREQEHLAAAVTAKDAEITELKRKNQENLDRIKAKHEDVVAELNNKINDLLAKATKPRPEDQAVMDQHTKENVRLVRFINDYKDTFKSFLKASQGTLENAITLEHIQYTSLITKGD